MERKTILFSLVLLFALMVSSCMLTTFSPPTEIHITDLDQVEQAVVAVDGNGRSHIAGVVNDRIVYYRTRYGEPLAKFAMVMSGSGADWKQYSPDIAAMMDGTAYIVWVEQHGGPEKFACWRYVPLYPPVGGYQKACLPLDSTTQTTGNVRVISNGYFVYAVYDRMYLANGRIEALMYKELPNITNAGVAYDYINYSETGYIYGLDMVIDTAGKLHIAMLDNTTVTGAPPYTDRLLYRSNRTTDTLGTMSQGRTIATGSSLGEDVDPSISIYTDSVTGPRIGIASICTPTGIDYIYIDSCTVDGCEYVGTNLVDLPSSWDTHSVIEDLEIQGRDEYIYLGFIGDDNTSASGGPQVYFTEVFNTTTFSEPSDGSASFKYDLEMNMIIPRGGSGPLAPLPVISWAESDWVTATYYAAGWLSEVVKVSEDRCPESMVAGDVSSNGMYLSGVWDACSDTWFTTQAWTEQLPLILK